MANRRNKLVRVNLVIRQISHRRQGIVCGRSAAPACSSGGPRRKSPAPRGWAGRVSFALRPRAEVAPEMLRRSGGGVYGFTRGLGVAARSRSEVSIDLIFPHPMAADALGLKQFNLYPTPRYRRSDYNLPMNSMARLHFREQLFVNWLLFEQLSLLYRSTMWWSCRIRVRIGVSPQRFGWGKFPT